MNRWGKLGIVVAGYVLAMVASTVTVMLYDRRFTAADNQQMGGMIAGGEMMLGFAVFMMVALVPTGLGVWFVRRNRTFWSLFTTTALAFAIIGLAAVLTPLFTGPEMRSPVLTLVGLLSIVQMFGSPLWIGGFGLFALLAPERDLRTRLLVGLAIEVVIAGCGLLHFVLPRPPI
jgi:hypothetical protein